MSNNISILYLSSNVFDVCGTNKYGNIQVTLKEALDGGCDEYETKPVRLPSLLEKIEHFT